MKNKYIFSIFFLFITLGGCSAPGPNFQPIEAADSQAIIYIYRLSRFAGSGDYPWVYIDGAEKAPLKNGGYIVYAIEPGLHEIVVKAKSSLRWNQPEKKVSLNASEGQEYYLKLNYDVDVGLLGGEEKETSSPIHGSIWEVRAGAGLDPVEKSLAEKEIKSLKMSR